MADRIYVTYTPTGAPGSFHTAIHYERTDLAGNVVNHFIIEAEPENLEKLSVSDKAIGVVEEAFRNGDGPSRFGRIHAEVRRRKASGEFVEGRNAGEHQQQAGAIPKPANR
jgi:hypothetical protein